MRASVPASAGSREEVAERPGQPGASAPAGHGRDARRHRLAFPEAVDQATGRERPDDPHQCESADDAGRGGRAHAEMTRECRDARRYDPVSERDGERYRTEDAYLRWKITEQSQARDRHNGHSFRAPTGRGEHSPPPGPKPRRA